MMRPLVKATSSRICIIPSQPARLTAGPMNLEQMSRSLRSLLFIEMSVICTSPRPDQPRGVGAQSLQPIRDSHIKLEFGFGLALECRCPLQWVVSLCLPPGRNARPYGTFPDVLGLST